MSMEKKFIQIKNKRDILREGMGFEQWIIWLPEVILTEDFTPNIGGGCVSQGLIRPEAQD